MFKSGFEYPANYLRCYQELIGRKIEPYERIPLINDFNECQRSWHNAQQRKKIGQ